MSKKKVEVEDEKKFTDLTQKSWFRTGDSIKVGDNFSEIHEGRYSTLDIKEIYSGDPLQTWVIIIDSDDKIYLLKSSKNLNK